MGRRLRTNALTLLETSICIQFLAAVALAASDRLDAIFEVSLDTEPKLTAPRFKCYTCNVEDGADDTQPCVDKEQMCASDVRSCSTVVFYTSNRNGSSVAEVRHVRKFCTSSGVTMNEKIIKSPKNSVCRNIVTRRTVLEPLSHTTELPVVPDNTFNIEPVDRAPPSIQPPPGKFQALNGKKDKRAKRAAIKNSRIQRDNQSRGPPAPPSENLSSVICTCNELLCNSGNVKKVMSRSKWLSDFDEYMTTGKLQRSSDRQR